MAAVVGGFLVLAAAGCGVPSSGSPVVDGTVNANGSSGVSGPSAGPPGPDSFGPDSTALDFVEGYLTALAGLPPSAALSDEVGVAQAWIKTGPCTTTRVPQCPQWAPQTNTTAISVIRAPVGSWGSTRNGSSNDVSGTAQLIGTFTPSTGVLQPIPPEQNTMLPLKFSVVPNTSNSAGRWRLSNPPPILLLSEDALSAEYTAHPVYFWSGDHTALIPDIRYLPNSLSTLRKATQIVEWVLDGHSSPWLDLSGSLAPGATLVDPTVRVADSPANQYIVNLSASARSSDKGDLALLGDQLRWSLGTITADDSGSAPSDVKLLVDGQDPALSTGNGYRDDVPNLRQARSYTPAATFGIVNGKVEEVDIGPQGAAGKPGKSLFVSLSPDQPAVLDSRYNSLAVRGAVDGTRTAAALVRHDQRTGSDQLWIRWLTKGVTTEFQQVNGLPQGSMSRPQFIVQQSKDSQHPAAVVAIGGHLYVVAYVGQGQPTAKQIQTTTTGTGPITAFSIAPDAHRIAYVSQGRLYISILLNASGSLIMMPGTPINTAPGGRQVPGSDVAAPVGLNSDSVSQVAWASVDKLLIVGKRGTTDTVDEISLDGSAARQLTQEYTGIDQLTSYVYDPLRLFPPGGDNVMVGTGKTAWSGYGPLSAVQLQLPDPGHALIDVRAPFFQD